MQQKFKELASVLIGALLLSVFNIGVVALPANADAAAPATLFDYESNSVGMNGWSNVLGYTSANDNSAWGNYVNSSDQSGGSTTGTIMVKGQKGNSVSNTAIGSVGAGSSLISSTTRTVTMNFYAPQAGKIVVLGVAKSDYSATQTTSASALTVVGWQALSFEFPNTIDFTQEWRNAWVAYDTARESGGGNAAENIYFYDNVAFNGAASSPLAPATLFNYESETVGMNGWSNVLGYTSANDNTAWGNYVNASDQAGGSVTGTKMVKGQKGNSESNTAIGFVGAGSSLISSTSRSVTMNFYAPTAGKTVVLGVQKFDYSSTVTVSATAVTVAGWQVLTFTFPTSVDYSQQWRRAWVSYDWARTSGGGNATENIYFYDDVSFNGATPAALTAQQQQSQVVTTFSETIQYTFETKPSGWEAFEGASADIVSTPAGANSPSGSYSGYITESDTVGVQTWAGLVIDVRTSSEVISATSKTVQLRVKAPTATTSVTLKLEAPGNDPGGSTPTLYVQESATPGTTSWTVITFDFTSPDAGTYTEASNYTKIVAFFNLGLKDPISQTLYFDDLAFTPNQVAANNASSGSPNAGFTFNNENKGKYPHIRLDKGFLDTYFDASWWDGVWQYRDADTKAYLKYLPVGGTFKLTYTVTNANNEPMAGALVTLIVNANYSCAKTYFVYENSLIGPDDCAGNGETQLPAKRTNALGQVSFVLTNTNTEGENMPNDLNGLPNGKELGTNIKPHLVGATQEGIDMLFAHFVQQKEAAKVVGPAPVTAKAGVKQTSTFQFLDEAGKPIADQYVDVYINGVGSRQTWAKTDASGKVSVQAENMANAEGTTAVAVSLTRTAQLPLTATALINWVEGDVMVSMAGSKNSVAIRVSNVTNKVVTFVVNGKTYIRKHPSGSVVYKFPSAAGKSKVSVSVAGKSFVRTLTVAK